MDEDLCGHENPANPAQTCDKPVHPFGAHMHRASMAVWPGLAMPEKRTSKTPKGARVIEVVDAIEASGNGRRTGPPGVPPLAEMAKSWQQRQREWLEHAKASLRLVCETHETFTNEAVWALVDDVRERRAMVIVTRTGLRNGWMHEDHAIRVHGVWRTRDGHEFPLNKLVPVYRSDLYTTESALPSNP